MKCSLIDFRHGARRIGPAVMFLVPLAFMYTATGCRKPAASDRVQLDPSQIDGARAVEEIRQLTDMGRRDSGTAGARGAAQYLFSRLREMKIESSVDAFEDNTPAGPVTFRNVMGLIPGSGDAWVVLGSHYDTKPGIADPFTGANDSGSSSGLLLELARVLVDHPGLPFNILLAFLDGEECVRQYGPGDGLHGSRRLVKVLQNDGRAEHVKAAIVLDMVGDRDLSITIPRNGSPHLISSVFRASEQERVRENFGLLRGNLLDDHQPFLEAGLPAVDIIDFEYGSEPGENDYWHTSDDTLDKLSADSLTVVGRVVIRVLNELMEGGDSGIMVP